MATTPVQGDGRSGTVRWWSVPQALAWIVTRDEARVEQVRAVRSIAALQRMAGLLSAATGDGRPVSVTAAPAELLRAARGRQITIMGLRGRDEARPVPVRQDTRFWAHGGSPSLGDEAMRRAGWLWSELSIRADACKACWPAPPGTGEALSGTRLSAPPTPKPTMAEMEAWYLARIESHDGQQPLPSREDDLEAAEDHFGIRGLKDLVRTTRRKLAPASWKQPGAKGRKRRAYAPSRPAAK